MRTLGNAFGFFVLLIVGLTLTAVAGLPHWIVQVVALLLLLALLRWVDDRLADGAGSRAVGWALRTVWAALSRWAARHGVRLPQPPARPAPVPAPGTYHYLVPGSDQVLTVSVLPAAVYDYWDPDAFRHPHDYIGTSGVPSVRHIQHVDDGRTFVDLPRDLQWYPCKCVALAVERAAIIALHPVQNIAHNGAVRLLP